MIFTPNTDIKDELAKTAVSITCYDRNGNIVRRVTSSDEGNVEDPENSANGDNAGGTDNSGSADDAGGSGGGSGSTGGSELPGAE